MKMSRRELSINVIIDWFVFKNNQRWFTLRPKTGMGLPKTGFFFLMCKLRY